MLYYMVASHPCKTTSDRTSCNKVIITGAWNFKCKESGWKLEREQLKGRCMLGKSPCEKRMDGRVAQMLGIRTEDDLGLIIFAEI